MLGNRQLILDPSCEIFDQLSHCSDRTVNNLSKHNIRKNSIYVIGRLQVREHNEKFKSMVDVENCLPVFSCSAEGSETLKSMIFKFGLTTLIQQGKILVIGGGDMDDSYPCLRYDSFLTKVFDYDENLAAAECSNEIFEKKQKPYKFLFLNGLARPHRKFLIEKFKLSRTIDSALWTCLDGYGFRSRSLSLYHNNKDLMLRPRETKLLPQYYEVDMFQEQINKPTPDRFVKRHLFKNLWGEIYIKPEPYIDTYFSLVTETVFEYPYSFRTEKICKPLAMAHPWIVAANRGYYRDIRNLGFWTFGQLIDESFDLIDNHQDRMNRIVDVVEDLCRQDLSSFITAAEQVCKYNQQHLRDLGPKLRSEFSDRFFNFIKPYIQ
jgi:hypothetical protein